MSQHCLSVLTEDPYGTTGLELFQMSYRDLHVACPQYLTYLVKISLEMLCLGCPLRE